jgi:hypothetical protein
MRRSKRLMQSAELIDQHKPAWRDFQSSGAVVSKSRSAISLQIRTAIDVVGGQNRRLRLNFCGAISILRVYP